MKTKFPLLLTLNIFGVACVTYSLLCGAFFKLTQSDATGFMIWFIFGLGMFGVVLTCGKSAGFHSGRGCTVFEECDSVGVLETKISKYLAFCNLLPTLLTGLGLLGTVMGLMIMTSSMIGCGISSVAAMTGIMVDVIGGFSLALYTTFVGMVFALWIMVNNWVLRLQAAYLITKAFENDSA